MVLPVAELDPPVELERLDFAAFYLVLYVLFEIFRQVCKVQVADYLSYDELSINVVC
jgi:hypothetical protein